MKNDIAEKIRLYRLSRNLSQQNMADELDITVGAYSNIERGKAEITVSRLMKIAKIFEIEVTDLFSPVRLLMDPRDKYGYATKAEMEELISLFRQYKVELEDIRKEMSELKKQSASSRKKS